MNYSDQELKLKKIFTTYSISKYLNDFDYTIICFRWDDYMSYIEIGKAVGRDNRYVWAKMKKIYSLLERIYVHKKEHLRFKV